METGESNDTYSEMLIKAAEGMATFIRKLAEALIPIIQRMCELAQKIIAQAEKYNEYLVLSALGSRALHFYKTGKRRIKKKYLNRAIKEAGYYFLMYKL